MSFLSQRAAVYRRLLPRQRHRAESVFKRRRPQPHYRQRRRFAEVQSAFAAQCGTYLSLHARRQVLYAAAKHRALPQRHQTNTQPRSLTAHGHFAYQQRHCKPDGFFKNPHRFLFYCRQAICSTVRKVRKVGKDIYLNTKSATGFGEQDSHFQNLCFVQPLLS